MSSAELGDFWVHTVTVETYLGVNGSGVKQYAAPVQPDGFLEAKRRLVRAEDGNQVVSESTFYSDLGNAALFTPASRVTLSGRPLPTTVITVDINDGQALDLPDHIAVALQ